jgi:hypothetical protein
MGLLRGLLQNLPTDLVSFLNYRYYSFLSVECWPISVQKHQGHWVWKPIRTHTAALKESPPLEQIGERIIQEKAQDVAKQVEIFVKSQPNSSLTTLSKNPKLKEIAVQKVVIQDTPLS